MWFEAHRTRYECRNQVFFFSFFFFLLISILGRGVCIGFCADHLPRAPPLYMARTWSSQHLMQRLSPYAWHGLTAQALKLVSCHVHGGDGIAAMIRQRVEGWYSHFAKSKGITSRNATDLQPHQIIGRLSSRTTLDMSMAAIKMP
jgi:hypothetical protein